MANPQTWVTTALEVETHNCQIEQPWDSFGYAPNVRTETREAS